jgi:hypothetical protein
MSEEKNETEVSKVARKVAPAITVRSPARKSSMDELYEDNPGKEFAYASSSSSADSLLQGGLAPVKGRDGKSLVVGRKVICEVVGDAGTKETAEQFAIATEAAIAVRDPLKSSPDKVASKKAPVKKQK